ncbi:MAG: bifunctional N(6)-L-threonylcarbamoyladenine synthase/serine/threonine protein kinase [Candidatus Baldrarchaeia archaeon]
MRSNVKVCIGIEGTAHTLGVGIATSDGKILANVADSYIPPPGGGIHPAEAARHHTRLMAEVIKRALDVAGISIDDVDMVAFSRGPGMGPCLRTVAIAARTLSMGLGVPLIGVNHIVAHIEIGRLVTGAKDPVTLIVSGGTTAIVAHAKDRYRVFGETLDIAIGNCFDRFAREVGIHDPNSPWPGPMFDKYAERGEKYIELPYTVKGMDLSFSGLLTAAIRAVKEGHRIEDVAYSLQETALAMITEVTERALAHTGKEELLLTGGFARNKRLQEMLRAMTEDRDAKFYVTPREYATDNGAMIAWTGILAYRQGYELKVEDSFVIQRWRVDEVEWKLLDPEAIE